MEYFSIKNFSKYQHYKDRNPPWIKLHFSLLHDRDFMSLTPSQRWELIGLWLLASQRRNILEYDPRILGDFLGNHLRIRLESFEKLGFIYRVNKNGELLNKTQADCGRDAIVETETETETEYTPPTPSKPTRKKATGPQAECIQYFEAGYLKKYRVPYLFVGAKDGVSMAELLKTFTVDQIKGMIDLYFNDVEPWLVGKDRGIALFRSRVNRYAQTLSQPILDPYAQTAEAKAEEERMKKLI